MNDNIKKHIQSIMNVKNLNCDIMTISCKDDKVNQSIKGSISYKQDNKMIMEQFDFLYIDDRILPQLTTPVLYTEDFYNLLCNEIPNAFSYTLRKVKHPFTSESEMSEIEFKYIEQLRYESGDDDCLYLIKANGDNEFYKDSDFSNAFYRPGTPIARGQITDEGIYTITVERHTSYLKTHLYIIDNTEGDFPHNEVYIYEGPDQTVVKNMFVGFAGEYTFNIIEAPFEGVIDTLQSPTITLKYTNDTVEV